MVRNVGLDDGVSFSLELRNLGEYEFKPGKQALDLGSCVGRRRLAETRSQLVQPTTAALPQGSVVVGTECRKNGIDPVDEGDPLADQLCPLANAPPRILVAFIRDRHHRADARLAAKPC